jgi:hypothetical protein
LADSPPILLGGFTLASFMLRAVAPVTAALFGLAADRRLCAHVDDPAIGGLGVLG